MPIVSVPKKPRKGHAPGPLVLATHHRNSPAHTDPTTATRPGLRTTPQRMTQGALAIAQAGAEVGPTEEQQQQSITMPVDPRVAGASDCTIRTLPGVPLIESLSGVTAEAQKARLKKFDQAFTVFRSGTQTAAKVDDSRSVMNRANTRKKEELKAVLLGAKGDPRLTPEQQRRLNSELDKLLAEEDRLAKQPVDQAQKTHYPVSE